MSRYIDAERIKQKKRFDSAKQRYMVWMSDIYQAPSIDIVRCKECCYCSKDRIKWSIKDEDGNWIDTKCNLCRRTKLEVNLDDYCSWGEREGE